MGCTKKNPPHSGRMYSYILLSTICITAIGSKYPMKPRNKIDHYDGILEPIPGFNIYGADFGGPADSAAGCGAG